MHGEKKINAIHHINQILTVNSRFLTASVQQRLLPRMSLMRQCGLTPRFSQHIAQLSGFTDERFAQWLSTNAQHLPQKIRATTATTATAAAAAATTTTAAAAATSTAALRGVTFTTPALQATTAAAQTAVVVTTAVVNTPQQQQQQQQLQQLPQVQRLELAQLEGATAGPDSWQRNSAATAANSQVRDAVHAVSTIERGIVYIHPHIHPHIQPESGAVDSSSSSSVTLTDETLANETVADETVVNVTAQAQPRCVKFN
eukprot:14360-Heterococcus_DN1.PRE.2